MKTYGDNNSPGSRGRGCSRLIWLFKKTYGECLNNNAPRLGAALAFYSLFSLAPTLMIVITIAGTVFGRQAVEGRVFNELVSLVGYSAANAVRSMLNSIYRSDSTVAGIVSAVTILTGATGVFVELQGAMNTIWHIRGSRSGLRALVRDRIVSFLIIIFIVFFLAALFIGSAVLNAMSARSHQPEKLLRLTDVGASFFVAMLLFALLYKFIPEASISWKDSWVGAAVTAVLFSIGKFLIGFYLGRGRVASIYGGAAAVMLILIWVYYSAQIIILGAAFTRVYANSCGRQAESSKSADSTISKSFQEPYKDQEIPRRMETSNCETCGNDCDTPMEILISGKTHVFDSFECAVHALAPVCRHCGCRVLGHGVESEGDVYCCAHCAAEMGVAAVRDRA